MHDHSKFHEKRGFRLEQIRQKQAKGFGRTRSFRHDIGFRMRQTLYFRHFKPPSRANRGSCRTTKGYWVSDGHQWLADVAIYARKSTEDISKMAIDLQIKECTKYATTSKQNMFNCFIISAVIAYLNNCDLNLFMRIDEKLQIESELI